MNYGGDGYATCIVATLYIYHTIVHRYPYYILFSYNYMKSSLFKSNGYQDNYWFVLTKSLVHKCFVVI